MNYTFIRPMTGRDTSEAHRAATPLELFFDLISVIAIAAAASGLHHAIAENHVVDGLIKYIVAFWAIWWAWMNFTWFASAYDNDDVPYRIAVMIMMVGALIMAAGIPYIFSDFDSTLGVLGFVIMRLALGGLWLRAARHDPQRRKAAQRYAIGITLCQTLWVLGYFLVPSSLFLPFVAFAFACELTVPVIAEKAVRTTWHRDHIIERYGLLTIIVLGESLLAMATAISTTSDISLTDPDLLLLIAGGLLIVFVMWWLYFSEVDHEALNGDLSTGLLWGYGHLAIFASVAAVGAGLAVGVDKVTNHTEISSLAANAAISIPVAIYVLGLWFIHERFNNRDDIDKYLFPATTLVILLSTYLSFSALAIGLALAICLVLKLQFQARRASNKVVG